MVDKRDRRKHRQKIRAGGKGVSTSTDPVTRARAELVAAAKAAGVQVTIKSLLGRYRATVKVPGEKNARDFLFDPSDRMSVVNTSRSIRVLTRDDVSPPKGQRTGAPTPH